MIRRFLNPFRLASYVLLFFAYGHTAGAVIKIPRFGAESDAVVSAMQTVHLSVMGSDCTWYGFYRGFGWFVTMYLVFSAVLAFVLGGATGETRAALRPIGWALLAVQVACTPLPFIYFFPPPMVFQTLATALIALGCLFQLKEKKA